MTRTASMPLEAPMDPSQIGVAYDVYCGPREGMQDSSVALQVRLVTAQHRQFSALAKARTGQHDGEKSQFFSSATGLGVFMVSASRQHSSLHRIIRIDILHIW